MPASPLRARQLTYQRNDTPEPLGDREASSASSTGPDSDSACECGGTGEVFGHADDCADDLCALNGDNHSCSGQVLPCACVARACQSDQNLQ